MHGEGSMKVALKAVGVAALYYVGVSVVSSELALLNVRLAPTVPWSILATVVVLWFTFAPIKTRLRCYPMLEPAASAGATTVFALAATVCCVSIAIIQGRLNEAVLSPSRFGIATDPGLAMTYAISMPIYIAVTEEIAFRGILQGHLASKFGSTVAAITSALLFVAAHAWKSVFVTQFCLYIAVSIATAGITAKSHYLMPAIVIHVLTNLVLALMPWIGGPYVLLEFSPESMVGFVFIAIVAMLCAIAALFRVKRASPRA